MRAVETKWFHGAHFLFAINSYKYVCTKVQKYLIKFEIFAHTIIIEFKMFDAL